MIGSSDSSSASCDKYSAKPMHPTDLPIYGASSSDSNCVYVSRPPGWLEQSVGDGRRHLQSLAAQNGLTYSRILQIADTALAHSATSLDYLQQQENVVARATALTAGGLTGLLAAALRRRSLPARLLYTTLGLTVPLAVCYPGHTMAYTSLLYGEAHKYVLIGWHFVTGVKPGQGTVAATPGRSPVQPNNSNT